jgi:hypothetical protein
LGQWGEVGERGALRVVGVRLELQEVTQTHRYR